MTLDLLIIEDDLKIRENLVKAINGSKIAGYSIKVDSLGLFDDGLEKIKSLDYDIIILDLYKDQDDNSSTDETAGIKILEGVRKLTFVPVIFYTGHAHKIKGLISEIVGVISKGDGIEKLISEIERIINSKLALLKKNIHSHVSEQLRNYFWETVDTKKDFFDSSKTEYSLGYLLLRRLANSLSKENIKVLLGDDKILDGKAHPMEFYIYPSITGEYQVAEILNKDDCFFVILTPSCDLISRSNGGRKAEKVLLANTRKFTDLPHYKKYDELKSKQTKSAKENEQYSNLIGILKGWMKNTSGDKDRYFFLPFTPFIENLVIDFQDQILVDYHELQSYSRIAKLDSPFAESMIASFTRYYSRIGFPDLDSDYVFNSLAKQ